MPALFEITQDILEAYETLVDSDGELSLEAEGKIAAIAAIQNEKLDSYFYVIRKAEMEEAAAKAHAEQWQKKAAARRKAIEWLKNAVQTHLTATGAAKVTTPNGNTFAVQKNGGKKPIIWPETAIDLTQVPDAYVKIVKTIDNDAVRTQLEAGVDLSFAHLGESGSHLRLR